MEAFFTWVRLTEFIVVHNFFLKKEKRELLSPTLHHQTCSQAPEPAGISQYTLIPSRYRCFSACTTAAGMDAWIARLSLCSCRRHPHSCPACHQDVIKAPPHRLWLLSLFFPLCSFTHRLSMKSSSFCSALFGTWEDRVETVLFGFLHHKMS